MAAAAVSAAARVRGVAASSVEPASVLPRPYTRAASTALEVSAGAGDGEVGRKVVVVAATAASGVGGAAATGTGGSGTSGAAVGDMMSATARRDTAAAASVPAVDDSTYAM